MSTIANFDPNSVGLKSNNIFGLPFSAEEAQLVLLPVPWEVTVSYRPGTASGPEKIFDAAMQVDLFDPDVADGWKKGFHMLPVDDNILAKSDSLRRDAEMLISHMADGVLIEEEEHLNQKLTDINAGGKLLLDWVYEQTLNLLKQGKKVGLIGGDHSTPLGFIKALSTIHDEFAILQIDAHADLRIAYEGFTYSHASIMYNVLQQVPQVKRLVQVGIRDYCNEELQMINESDGRIITYFDKNIKAQQYEGVTWKAICEQIVTMLPKKVYISFDIDGLDPKLCPNTGTPVPGGFEAEQVFYLFKMLLDSGKKIIGFDLNEVSGGDQPGDSIDAIVGARVLFKLCNFMVA
jgi:agmatinase